MDKIIGLGNALVDVLATLKDDTLLTELALERGCMQLIDENKLKQINNCLAKMETHMATGGSAANAILALACLGAPVGFVGKVGKDAYGDFFRENLRKHRIADGLKLSDTLPSGVASTFISPDGERTFGTYLGAAAALKASDLTRDMFDGYSYLFVEGYLVQDHDLMLHALELAKETGVLIAFDMASSNIVAADRDFFSLLLNKYVDIVFANEEEAKAYTGKSDAVEALDMMAKECSVAVVKVGAKGAHVQKGSQRFSVPACSVPKVVDTTGAGDYFAAGFLYGMASGRRMEQCARIGALLSGSVIQVIGTTLPSACWDEITLNIGKILAE